MESKVEVTKHIISKNGETFNVFVFKKNNMLNFYIEREGYFNLYYCASINDNMDDLKQFIENNLDDWIFIVMNETEED